MDARRVRAFAVMVAVGASVVACGSPTRPIVAAHSPPIVPWVDRPAPVYQPSPPITTTPPPADAPPCRADQVAVLAGPRNGATGHTAYSLTFTNTSGSICLLSGYPMVVATEPGQAPVTAHHGAFFPDPGPGANVGPGDRANLILDTERDCPARDAASPSPELIYHQVMVYLPDGTKAIGDTLDVLCGLFETRFGVPQPPATYAPSPAGLLRAAIQAPPSARPGQLLDYVVALANPTAGDIPLSPCPGYLEYSPGMGRSAKYAYALNCDTVTAVPAHGVVRYAMRMAVPVSAPAGSVELYWQIIGSTPAAARATIRITEAQMARPSPRPQG